MIPKRDHVACFPPVVAQVAGFLIDCHLLVIALVVFVREMYVQAFYTECTSIVHGIT